MFILCFILLSIVWGGIGIGVIVNLEPEGCETFDWNVSNRRACLLLGPFVGGIAFVLLICKLLIIGNDKTLKAWIEGK